MAIAFGNVEGTDFVKAKSTTTTTSLSVNISALSSGNTGKLLVAVFYHAGNSGLFSEPAGWTVANNTTAANGGLAIFWRVCTGDETTVAAGRATAVYTQAQVYVISGADTTTPINTYLLATRSGGVSWASPVITTTVDGCLIFQGGGATGVSDWATNDEPTGTTLIAQESNTAAWFGMAFESQTSAGTLGTRTWDNNSNAKYAVSFAIAPSTGGAGLTITSVTPSTFDSGVEGIVIAGTGFGASQGSSTVTIGSTAQTVTAWSDTSITFTSVRGSESMGAGTLTVTKV